MSMWNQMATTHVVAYLNGVATDITQWVLIPPRGGQISSARGRQTELAQMDPSRMSLVLENRDGRFTPGNPLSPYYPYWRQAIRIVWTETVGARTFTNFDGPLEIPEVQLNYQAADPTINDATLSASAVDTLTQLGRARPFVSTLAEHIKYNGGSSLRGYWPFLESGPPAFREIARRLPSVMPSKLGGTLATPVSAATVSFGGAPTLFADDVTAAQFTGGLDASNSAIDTYGVQFLLSPSNIVLSAGETATMVFWIRPENDPAPVTDRVGGLFLTQHNIQISRTATTVTLDCSGSFLTGSITLPALPSGQWMPLAIRFGYTPSVFEAWIRGQQITGTLSGSAPAIELITGLIAPYTMSSSVGHVQLYSGDPTAYTFANFQAQYEMGLTGLERQTTGERIRTIAAYAGVSASALDRIDDGSTVMQRASLAGKTPLAAMQEAADTERGRLFTAGDGSIVFHDRHRIYNT